MQPNITLAFASPPILPRSSQDPQISKLIGDARTFNSPGSFKLTHEQKFIPLTFYIFGLNM